MHEFGSTVIKYAHPSFAHFVPVPSRHSSPPSQVFLSFLAIRCLSARTRHIPTSVFTPSAPFLAPLLHSPTNPLAHLREALLGVKGAECLQWKSTRSSQAATGAAPTATAAWRTRGEESYIGKVVEGLVSREVAL